MPGPSTGGQSAHRLKWNVKDGTKLLAKAIGDDDYQVIGSFDGELESVDYYKNNGNKERDIPAYWAYKLTFSVEGAEDPKWNGTWVLELNERHRLADNMINSLASREDWTLNRTVYFRLYEKDGWPSVYFKDSPGSDDPMAWKYRWEDQPEPEITTEIDENGDFKKTYFARSEFWRSIFLNEVYPAVNGKDYAFPSDQNYLRKVLENNKQILSSITKESFPDKWKTIAQFIRTKFRNPDEIKVIAKLWTDKWKELGGKGSLCANGSIGEKSEAAAADTSTNQPASDEADDDLPF